MKLIPRAGETWLRITPPVEDQPGYCQAGTVELVTDNSVVLLVRCDIMRRMTFCLETGLDTSGLGTFIVKPDATP